VEVSGKIQAPVRFNPKKETRYPLNRKQGRRQSCSWRLRKRENSLPLPGFENRTVQPVASRYTNYAIPNLWPN